MTNRTRRTRITIEQHEVRIIRHRSKGLTAYCEQCGSIVTAFISEDKETMFQVPGNETRDLETEGIHFIETADGDLPLICDGSPKQ